MDSAGEAVKGSISSTAAHAGTSESCRTRSQPVSSLMTITQVSPGCSTSSNVLHAGQQACHPHGQGPALACLYSRQSLAGLVRCTNQCSCRNRANSWERTPSNSGKVLCTVQFSRVEAPALAVMHCLRLRERIPRPLRPGFKNLRHLISLSAGCLTCFVTLSWRT